MRFLRNKRGRKRILVIAICLVVILLIHNRWGYAGNCVLCNSCPYHEPCIISLSDGTIIPLTVYDPHLTIAGALAEEQADGHISIAHYPGLYSYRDTDAHKTIAKIQAAHSDPLRRAFCYSCRKALKQFSQTGFVMVDLQSQTPPVLFPLANETEITMRCYEITTTFESDTDTYVVCVQGLLEQP